MGDWRLRDIGRAVTGVQLGFIDYSSIENKFNYQEFNLSSVPSSQGSKELSIYPAEKWSSHFETFSPLWESVPQMDCYKLAVNQDPDAPKQTFIYGYLSSSSTAPDLVAADQSYYPPDASYVTPTSSGQISTTSAAATVGTGQSFLPPITSSVSGLAPVQIAASYVKDRPFIPSSIDHLANDATPYKTLIGSLGLQIHNIWKIAPSYVVGGLSYLRNHGPIWTDSGYAGATADQGGQPGAYRVKVNANKGALMLQRVAPMNCDIGFDYRYPWVFPYMDPTSGQVMHGALYSQNENGYFGNEIRTNNGKTNVPNIGFKMNIDVSAEGPRGSFSGSGGGISQVVTVMWGWDDINNTAPQSPNGFAKSFNVTFANNKAPSLSYFDGTRIVNIPLEDSPVSFNEGTNLSLTVEYLSTSMLVKTNNGAKLIDAQSGLKGVWTDNPNIAIFVGGCVATFDFMPVYYNSWSPFSDIRLNASSIVTTKYDNGNHTPSNLSFNPLKPETGFAKLIAAACFNTYAEPDQAVGVLDQIFEDSLTAFDYQDYTPNDIKQAAISPYNAANRYQPESGWPQCIVDSRTAPLNGPPPSCRETNAVFRPIAEVYNIGSGITNNSLNGYTARMPVNSNKDPMSNLSVIWQVTTTYTTPLIFGFKTHEYPAITWPMSPWKDISDYVSKWTINWNSEQDYKILRAKGSITLLNPPGYIIDTVSKNRMHVQIFDTGYVQYSSVVDDEIKPYIYRHGNIFTGLTVNTSLLFGPGGDVYFTIECVDPIKFLEDYRLETNLRFDGVSYFMAFSTLMQSSDYSNMFIVEDQINRKEISGGWRQYWRGGPTIHPGNPAITYNGMGGDANYYYNSMFFGYQPMAGRSYEVQAGTQLFDGLMEIMKNMHNPMALPLFYFRPSDGMFVFQVRSGADNVETDAKRPKLKSEIDREDDLRSYIPLLCVGNQETYKMTSDTSGLTSHFTVTGSDRATGQAIKATAINPNWHSLQGKNLNQPFDSYVMGNQYAVTHTNPISGIFGHLGYKRRMYQNVGNFVADINGAFAYAMSRVWWLMRPVIHIEDLTSYGIIDYLDDGMLNINLGGLEYNKTLLKQSTISYDADQGSVISRFSVFLFPPWSM